MKAQALSQFLNLSIIPQIKPSDEVMILLQGERLELLIARESNPLQKPSRVYAEFLRGSTGYRTQKGGGLQQLIAKALGLRGRQKKPFVVDATAGLGEDGYILASLGCSVLMIERSPIIYALLKDGLLRAALEENPNRQVSDLITAQCGDAKEILSTSLNQTPPDIIYLDPMFPSRQKSALVKIEMRAIRSIVGEDEDASALLKVALQVAQERVVVKRPLKAPWLDPMQKPDFSVYGQRNRYDIYKIHLQG